MVGVTLMFLANLRDGELLQQMKPEDFYFLYGAEMPPRLLIFCSFLVAHALYRVGKSSLARAAQSVIPSEPQQIFINVRVLDKSLPHLKHHSRLE